MRAPLAILTAASVLLALAGCQTNDIRQPVFAAPPGPAQTANAGDTVMDVRIERPPLSAIGLQNWVGRKEMNRIVVRFTGATQGKATFVRNDMVMARDGVAPLWVPVGVASPIDSYAAAAQPITLSLGPGEFLPLEGRRLVVRQVDAGTLQYDMEEIAALPPETPR